MPLDKRDAGYLWDMLDSAKSVFEFTGGISQDEYLENRMCQLAVERSLEIIGEAAKRVSDGFKREHDEIPWRSLIGLRNVLAHEYGEIKRERIWVLAKKEIPELIGILNRLLPGAD
jgi:uncharacterized protein with HEPN domain